jgi:hypothetical protein
MSYAPYGRRLDRTAYEARTKQPRDLVGAIETSPSGNTVLRIGREIDGEGRWTQIAHVVMTPDEAWRFAAEVADAQPPEEVVKLARELIEMWRAGQRMYDAEEIDATVGALARALPPKHEPPVETHPDDPF